MPTRRVSLDSSLCEGHGRCYLLSPDVFSADAEGNGEVVTEELTTDALVAAAELAAMNCPESAITIVETPDPLPEVDAPS